MLSGYGHQTFKWWTIDRQRSNELASNLVAERDKVAEAIDVGASGGIFLASKRQENGTAFVTLVDLEHLQLLDGSIVRLVEELHLDRITAG